MGADLRLKAIGDSVQLTATSVHGMLWLQCHFEPSTWELICSGQVRITSETGLELSRSARQAGLAVAERPEIGSIAA